MENLFWYEIFIFEYSINKFRVLIVIIPPVFNLRRSREIRECRRFPFLFFFHNSFSPLRSFFFFLIQLKRRMHQFDQSPMMIPLLPNKNLIRSPSNSGRCDTLFSLFHWVCNMPSFLITHLFLSLCRRSEYSVKIWWRYSDWVFWCTNIQWRIVNNIYSLVQIKPGVRKELVTAMESANAVEE